jgi:NAD(P)H-dependent FMN reductase
VKGESHDGSCAWSRRVTRTTVLVVAGISASSIDRALADAAAQCLQNGVTLNVFDGLACLPSYSETLEGHQLPRAAATLRNAARDAHAAIVLTDYYGQIPATVHNAIDWLTRGWNDGSLHDKPLAVIGATEGRYSGVWSRHQTDGYSRDGETRVIEAITVTTLHEAVTNLAEQANMSNRPPTPLPRLRPHSRTRRADAQTELS